MVKQVFLGGSCDPTTWRQKIAIPMLESAKTAYFNPQVTNWTPEFKRDLEDSARRDSEVLLFVVTGETLGIASLTEIAGAIGLRRNVVLSVQDVVAGTVIDGETIGSRVAKDANRGRVYVRDFAKEHNVPLFDNVESAVKEVIRRLA